MGSQTQPLTKQHTRRDRNEGGTSGQKRRRQRQRDNCSKAHLISRSNVSSRLNCHARCLSRGFNFMSAFAVVRVLSDFRGRFKFPRWSVFNFASDPLYASATVFFSSLSWCCGGRNTVLVFLFLLLLLLSSARHVYQPKRIAPWVMARAAISLKELSVLPVNPKIHLREKGRMHGKIWHRAGRQQLHLVIFIMYTPFKKWSANAPKGTGYTV